MNKEELEKQLQTKLTDKSVFEKYVTLTNKLNQIAGGLFIIGALLVFLNIISTIETIVTEVGFRYLTTYFFDVFFSTHGSNIVFAVFTWIGFAALVLGGIGFIIFKFQKENLVNQTFSDFHNNPNVLLKPTVSVNSMYLVTMESEDEVERLEEFLDQEEDKNVKKLKKYLKRVSYQVKPKQVKNMIQKYSGLEVELLSVIPKSSELLAEVSDGTYSVMIVDSKGKKYPVNIKKMEKDSVISLR